MKKTLVLFFIMLILPMVACSVLQGDIDGNVELNGNELHTENAGNVVINTPNPTKNTNIEESPKVSDNIETSIPTPTSESKVTDEPTAIATPVQTPFCTETPDNNKENEENVLNGLKICIDAGHQQKGNSEKERCAPWNDIMKSKCTSGTTGVFTGIDEYVMNLEIALKIRDELVKYGADVLMIRENHNVDISNKERAEMANDFAADITLRIHGNSCDTPSVNGIELFVRDIGDGTSKYKKKSDADYKIASDLLGYICESTGAKSRGVKRSDAYTGINWCEGTCIIIECGFMSNEKEDKLMNTKEYQQKIADGIKNYFVSSMS